MRIGIDLMGGDRSAIELFPALLHICKEYACQHTLVAFVQHSLVLDLQEIILKNYPEAKKAIEFVTSSSFITMNESPLLAVRRKKDSSMATAMRMLAKNEIDVMISLGNTGALVATAMLYLPMLPNLERPALMVSLPSAKRDVIVLDVGANISPRPEYLVDYAKMGLAYSQAFYKTKKPLVGLLNVGVEEIKGTSWHREAYQLLEKHCGATFVGNIEGRQVFEGAIDILVTDGFSGNVFLKTCEGVASFLTDYLSHKMPRFGGLKNGSLVAHLHKQFNYSERPGALLSGVEGLVIKCHGHSTVAALKSGLRGAIAFAEVQLLSKIKTYL